MTAEKRTTMYLVMAYTGQVSPGGRPDVRELPSLTQGVGHAVGEQRLNSAPTREDLQRGGAASG